MRTKADLITLHIVHFALALLVPIFIFGLTGCLEDLGLIEGIEEQPPAIGKQVPQEEVQAAIDSALDGYSPRSLQVEDEIFYEFNLKIETGPVIKTREVYERVIEKESLEDRVRIRLYRWRADYTKEETEVVEEEDVIDVPKESDLPQDPLKPEQILTQMQSSREEPPTETTYHSLKVGEAKLKLPTGCESNCTNIQATNIRFDVVRWYGETEFDKLEILMQISTDVPWLGSLVNFCQKQKITLEGRKALVNSCQVLRDFSFGL